MQPASQKHPRLAASVRNQGCPPECLRQSVAIAQRMLSTPRATKASTERPTGIANHRSQRLRKMYCQSPRAQRRDKAPHWYRESPLTAIAEDVCQYRPPTSLSPQNEPCKHRAPHWCGGAMTCTPHSDFRRYAANAPESQCSVCRESPQTEQCSVSVSPLCRLQ